MDWKEEVLTKVDEIMVKYGYSYERACNEYCDAYCIHCGDEDCNPYACPIWDVTVDKTIL